MNRKNIIEILLWTMVIILSIYFYLDNAVAYLFGYRNERFGSTILNNQIWFIVHIIGATLSLFLGPIQFWGFVRNNYWQYHRLAGKLYVLGSLLAGFSALRLSLINDCTACRYSLFLLSLLFIFTTLAAWYAIKHRNVLAHKQFMVRSYTCALAFVFTRLNQIIPMDFIFNSVVDDNSRRIVNEWIFSFLPLLIAEMYMIWIPSLKAKRKTI